MRNTLRNADICCTEYGHSACYHTDDNHHLDHEHEKHHDLHHNHPDRDVDHGLVHDQALGVVIRFIMGVIISMTIINDDLIMMTYNNGITIDMTCLYHVATHGDP